MRISSSGSIPVPAKVAAIKEFVAAIKEFPPVVEMMRFCGMANFYYRFVPCLSLLMELLFKVTAGAKKGDKIEWTNPL